MAREREPQFKALPGLLQKYYVKTDEQGEYGGICVLDSMGLLQLYRESELAATIPQAYKLVEPPNIEPLDVLFRLHERTKLIHP